MVTYTFNENLEILVVKVSGILEITDILNHYNELSENDSYPFGLKVIIDTRGSDFKIRPEEINLTHDKLKEAITKYTFIREAIIVDKPHTTVVASLFQNSYYDLKKYSFMIFSTKRAAMSWLR